MGSGHADLDRSRTQASRLYVYIATSLTDSDLSKAINNGRRRTWPARDRHRWANATCCPYLDGSMAVDDTALAQAAAQGQTFFASTGDTGSSCAVAPTNGVPASGPPDTEYPASSPYAVAVGGTTLLTDDSDNYQSELAWNAGGGGISPVEKARHGRAASCRPRQPERAECPTSHSTPIRTPAHLSTWAAR